MMNISKPKLAALLLAVFIAVGALCAYAIARKALPTVLSANLGALLSEATGQPVSIGASSVKLFPGINISIGDVRVGPPGKTLVEARRVRVRVSLWRALSGTVRLSRVSLENPVIFLDREALEKIKLKQEHGDIPPVEIRGGIVKLPGEGERTVAEGIAGLIEQKSASLSAVVLGGRTRLKAKHTGSGWKGTLSSSGMDLSRISQDIGGTFGVELDFDLSGNRTASSLNVAGKRLRLPWSEAVIPSFELRLGANGNDKALSLHRIEASTPLVKISGTGLVRDIGKGAAAGVSLNLSSSPFVYEKILAFIPTKDFDPWLSELLTSQIRGGMSSFSTARYEGTVRELLTFDRFLDRIHVVQEAMGQSFAARPGLERITGVTGQVVYSRGGIFLRNLRGNVRGSVLQKLDISFYQVMSPWWIIGVDARVDMAARDFLDAWNAAGMPGYVIDLFEDISRVQAGRVRGAMRFAWDDRTGKPVQAQGRVDLDNCSYRWGKAVITGHTGSAVWPAYGAPLEITSRMNADGRAVRSLNIVVADPFDTMQSTFAAYVEGLVTSKDFDMGKGTAIAIRGTGTGLNISASAEVSSGSVTLFDAVYRMRGRPITLTARVKGPLSPKMSLSLTGEATGLSPGRLALTGSLEDAQDRIVIRGTLPLDQFEAVQGQKVYPLSGTLAGEVSVLSAEDVALTATLGLRNALLPVKGTPLKLAGGVSVSGPMLSGKRLRVARDTLKFVASDWTLDLSGTPAFKGTVTVDGLKLPLPGSGGGVPGNLGDLSAQGRLRIVNLDFYGIPVEEAQADAVLRGGVATLANVRAQGASILASGRMTAGTAGLLSFDTEFSLKGVSISKLLERYAPNQDFIRGSINLDGKLSGRPDSINGTVKLAAKDGKLKRYALISRVFAVLNVYKIIKTRDLELTSKNFPYNQIAATFVIRDSIAHFDDFFLDSNSLQFSAVGDYAFKSGTVDAILGVQPFESLDRTIRAIPLIGWVLTGDKGQLFIVSLKVTGKIDDPTVTFQPVKTVSDPVKKSLIRALKLPSELLKDSRDLFNGKKGS